MNKFIVVTGASKGIGRASADALAESGWSVIGLARSSPASFPGEFIHIDLGDGDKTEALARELAARGEVLGIVNNVGVSRHDTIEAVDLVTFATLMDVNVRPALLLTTALLPGMQAARFGRNINVTSLVTRGFAFRSSYATAKAALESLKRTWRLNLLAKELPPTLWLRALPRPNCSEAIVLRAARRGPLSFPSTHATFRTTA